MRAVRRYAGSITAVVSVADDGGSSGRLRRDLGVPPPGDIRRCLVALAGDDTVWAGGVRAPLRAAVSSTGHALGNLVLVGLTETLGSFPDALDEAGRLLDAVGRVLPATDRAGGAASATASRWPGGDVAAPVEGQVAVANTPRHPPGRPVPADRRRHARRVLDGDRRRRPGGARARLALHQRPAACSCVADSARRSPPARGRVVQVANLRPQVPETAGLDATDHLEAVLEHGVRVDSFVYDEHGGAGRRPATRSPALGRRAGGRRTSPATTGSPTIPCSWRLSPACSGLICVTTSRRNQWRFV